MGENHYERMQREQEIDCRDCGESTPTHACPGCGRQTPGAIRNNWRYAWCAECLDGGSIRLGPDALGRRMGDAERVGMRLRDAERAIAAAIECDG